MVERWLFLSEITSPNFPFLTYLIHKRIPLNAGKFVAAVLFLEWIR